MHDDIGTDKGSRYDGRSYCTSNPVLWKIASARMGYWTSHRHEFPPGPDRSRHTDRHGLSWPQKSQEVQMLWSWTLLSECPAGGD